MSLPKAVQAAAERSEALAKQLREGKPPEQSQGTTPQAQQQPDGTPDGQTRDTLPNQEVKQQTQPTQDQQPQATKEDEETYRQRYLTLKGKFDAQVPRLQQDNQRLNAVVTDLQNQMKRMQERTPADAQHQNNNGDNRSSINADAFEEYGPEFSTLAKTVQTLQRENERLRGQVQNLSGDFQLQKQADSQKAKQNYMGQVVGHVSKLGHDFNTLNTDNRFLNWLRQFPEGEVESRHEKLHRAEANMDLEATKEIFNEYLGRPKESDQPRQQQPAQQPPNIQPNTTMTGTDTKPPNTENKRMWTRKDISKFFADKVKGVYAGRDEDARAIEMDIHAASMEGRIRG